MTGQVYGFLQQLAAVPGLSVGHIHTFERTATAVVTDGEASAMLVCARKASPYSVDRKGRKSYGAYIIVDQGYGHWVKGDDAEQCVAYVLGWLCGRALSVTEALAPARLDVSASSAGDPVDATQVPHLVHEISERSSLRAVGGDVLVSPDRSLALSIVASDGLVTASAGSFSLILSADTVGEAAAALLGFADGVSNGSDE